MKNKRHDKIIPTCINVFLFNTNNLNNYKTLITLYNIENLKQQLSIHKLNLSKNLLVYIQKYKYNALYLTCANRKDYLES